MSREIIYPIKIDCAPYANCQEPLRLLGGHPPPSLAWLNNNDDISQIQLSNYTSIVQRAHSSTRGGLLIYIHETHTYKVLDNHFKFDTWEYQTVKISGSGTNKDFIIINIYRPPNDIQLNYKMFIDEFTILLSCFDKINSEIIITGVDIPISNWDERITLCVRGL